MLSSQEQMDIIKVALEQGYKGPIYKLIEQAVIEKNAQQQQSNTQKPSAPTPALGGKIPGDLPKSSTERNIIKPGQYQDGGVKDDTIIYPPGDSEYRNDPYNKEILDIRQKLDNPNVDNKDLQKAYEWEQWQEKLREQQDTNSPKLAKNGGFPEIPEDFDWDNISKEDQEKYNILPTVDIKRYGIDLTMYKNARQMGDMTKTPKHGMYPGHLQSRMVNPENAADFGYDYTDKTHIDPWDYGNRDWYQHATKKGKGIETTRLWLKPEQMEKYLDYANTKVKPSKGGVGALGWEGYNFLSNNCAGMNCDGLGVSRSGTRELGVVTPEKAYNKLKNYDFETDTPEPPSNKNIFKSIEDIGDPGKQLQPGPGNIFGVGTPKIKRGGFKKYSNGGKKEGEVVYGTPEYKEAYEAGTVKRTVYDKDSDEWIPTVTLPDVNIIHDRDVKGEAGNVTHKYPYYSQLSEEQKKYFGQDNILGRGVKASAMYGVGNYASSVKDFAGSFVTAPLISGMEVIQTPQSLLTEGIAQYKGEDYNYSNALPTFGTKTNKQRFPSDVIGFEDKPGWDLGGSLNTTMDVLGDPSNLIGLGLLSKANKGKNIINASSKVGPKTKTINLGNKNTFPIAANQKPGNIITEDISDLGNILIKKSDEIDKTRKVADNAVNEADDFFVKNFQSVENQRRLDLLPKEQGDNIRKTFDQNIRLNNKPYIVEPPMGYEGSRVEGVSGGHQVHHLGETRFAFDHKNPKLVGEDFSSLNTKGEFKYILGRSEPQPRYSQVFLDNLPNKVKKDHNILQQRVRNITGHELDHTTKMGVHGSNPRSYGNFDLNVLGGRNQLGVITQEGIVDAGTMKFRSKFNTKVGMFDKHSLRGEGIINKIKNTFSPTEIERRSLLKKMKKEKKGSGIDGESYLDYYTDPTEMSAKISGFRSQHLMDINNWANISKSEGKGLFKQLRKEDPHFWSVFKDSDAFTKMMNKLPYKKGGFKKRKCKYGCW